MPEPQQQVTTLRDLLTGDDFKNQVAKVLPSHITADRFIRQALTCMARNPKLADCTKSSFFKCLLDLSAIGLEADGRRAHLIPFRISGKNGQPDRVDCTLIVDWKGYVELAKRAGDVKNWRTELVCEKDDFSWEDGKIRHRIDWRQERGAVQCVYSQVTLPDGVIDNEVMRAVEVESIRRRSRAADSGPWVTDWNEMARKTVARRHSKRLTLSPEFHGADDGDFDSLPRVAGREIQDALPPAKKQSFLPEPPDEIDFDLPEAAQAEPVPEGKPPPKRATKKAEPAPAPAPPPPDSLLPEAMPAERLRGLVRASGVNLERVDAALAQRMWAPLAVIEDSEATEALVVLNEILKEVKANK